MKHQRPWALVGVLFMGTAFAVGVPDGGTVTLTHAKPPLPPAPNGAPGPNQWPGPGDADPGPCMMEDDGGEGPGTNDDPMGPANEDPTGTSASGTVTNSGGDLFGPRGGDQNGAGEGGAIEVKFCWPYYGWVKHVKTWPILTFDPPGIAFVRIVSWTWELQWVCSSPETVEPR